MTNDIDPNKKKKLPGWAITLIIIASLIVLIVLYRMIRQLSGIETPRSKDSRAQRRADRQAQKALKLAQNKKTRDFQQKYKSYITNAKATNQGLTEFEINDIAASQRISELISKTKFDIKQYKQFIKQIPTNIKKKWNDRRSNSSNRSYD